MHDIACVAAKAYANGNQNPLAHMHTMKLSLEKAEQGSKFLSNPEYKPFLRVTDCSQVSDGGAAVIFMSEDGLRKNGISVSDVVEVVEFDQGTGNIWEDP